MRSLLILLFLSTPAFAQMSQPIPGENATKISDHVQAIMGFPNIAIVVGSHATLIVDTGMGPKNGATIARVAARLAPDNTKLFSQLRTSIQSMPPANPVFPPAQF